MSLVVKKCHVCDLCGRTIKRLETRYIFQNKYLFTKDDYSKARMANKFEMCSDCMRDFKDYVHKRMAEKRNAR